MNRNAVNTHTEMNLVSTPADVAPVQGNFLGQVAAFGEAIKILEDARLKCLSVDWAWQRTNRAVKYLSKQQTALIEFHFADTKQGSEERQ